jgi:hypothetical protein
VKKKQYNTTFLSKDEIGVISLRLPKKYFALYLQSKYRVYSLLRAISSVKFRSQISISRDYNEEVIHRHLTL